MDNKLNYRKDPASREQRIYLEERLDTPIGKLSGGQRQALTTSMASWLKPDLLLLDEHTAALDPKTASVAELLVSNYF